MFPRMKKDMDTSHHWQPGKKKNQHNLARNMGLKIKRNNAVVKDIGNSIEEGESKETGSKLVFKQR